MTGRKLPRRHQPSFKKSPTQDAASCDFTIVVDGTVFKSQREILSSASNYFDALFRSNMRETQEGRVELQGITSETFAVVLNYIHQRVHGLTADNINDIWDVANRLDITIYLKEIEHFVIANLSIDNLWHYYLKAVDFNSNNVKDGSIMFITQNYEHVFKMKEFLNLPFYLMLSCIESEELNVSTEDSVLESILAWVSHGKYQQGACVTRERSKKRIACNEGQSRDVTSSVGQICDSLAVSEAGETDKPGSNVRKHGQHDDFKQEEHNGDVTKCSRTGDRASYLDKLMSSAKLTLATVSYLRSLLKNPYIIQCPDAYHRVQEALKYKCGVYPLESAILTPLRTSSEKRNALAFVGNGVLYLYDLETRTLSNVKLENVKGRYRNFKSVVSLGSTLCFICEKYLRNCPFATHKCCMASVLLLDENKCLSTLYELCGKHNSLSTLFRVNNKIVCVKRNNCYAATRSRIVDPGFFNTVTLIPGNFIPFCVFENNILLFKCENYFMTNNLAHDLTVKIYNLETKSLTKTKISNVGGRIFNILTIHKDKETFLLLSSGVILSVKRDSDSAIQFTPVVRLWTTFQWWLSGAVCYKNELTLFCTASRGPHLIILTSVPGLFDKINVVELGFEFQIKNMVPVVAPVSWFG